MPFGFGRTALLAGTEELSPGNSVIHPVLARHRKCGGVVADAEVDPSIIGGDVVDAIGCNLAELKDGEVYHPLSLKRATCVGPVIRQGWPVTGV